MYAGLGLLWGATDPNPPIDPHTGSAYIQPIDDVTPYFQRAADSSAAEEGTIYIPAGKYYGHLEITTNNKVSVLGDGQGTIIHGAPELSDGSISYKEVILVKRHWGVVIRISNIQIAGKTTKTGKRYNGISFDPADPQADGIVCENV